MLNLDPHWNRIDLDPGSQTNADPEQ
jgi:hypothetical protein